MLTFVLNPRAGAGKAARVEHYLRAELERYGSLHTFVHTEHVGHGADLAFEHAVSSAAVIAVGGDGTLNEVACGVLRADNCVPVGAVPVGTGNDFAWMLGMSSNPKEAVRQLIRAEEHTVDYGVARWKSQNDPTWRERPFFNAVGVGFDAQVTVRTSRYKHLGGSFAYMAGILSVLRSWTGPMVRISTSGESDTTVRLPLLLASVSNGRRVGGGYYLTPTAQLDDGLLDACIVRDMSTFRKLRLLPKAMVGRHTGAPEADIRKVIAFELASEHPLPLHVDGEIETRDLLELKASVVRHGIRVLVERSGSRGVG
jgi:YegS/Rv2252/BmrU family lipid kinase